MVSPNGSSGKERARFAAHIRVAFGMCVCAFLVYATLGLKAHAAFRTNAFDLSVFDYALWTTATGGPLGYVPMFRHSLFAQHFMPTLLVLTPLSQVFDSPEYLIVLQTLFYAVAGFLLFRFADRHVTRPLAFALLAAFLLSRRSHSAVTSHFYIESAEPMLIFGALLAWSSGRRTLYWATLVLAMGCKEDVAVYFLAFGAMIAVTGLDRKTGLATIAVAVAWLISSFGVAIPYWRGAYGLGAASPFLEGRYASTQGALAWALLDRLVSLQSLKRLITVTSATGYLCFLAPRWLAVALPGIALNLVAIPGTEQAALSGHYLWPILPWLFVAAVFGGTRLRGTTARWLPVMVLVVVLVDNPLPGSLARASWNASPETKLLKAQLQDLALSGTIAAQPNLIPHLPRRREMAAFGVLSAGQPDGEYVLLTTVGDLWPFDARGLADQVERLRNDPGYQQVLNGPLFAFRRRERRLTELSYKATLTAAPSNSSRP